MGAFGFILAVLGCTGLALTIDRHWRLCFPERPRSRGERIMLRIGAGAFLAESLMVCTALDPVGIAIIFWCVEIMLSALFVALAMGVKANHQR